MTEQIACIVPTLNAAITIERCLAAVRGDVGELLVVDGGSRDDTASVAAAAGARVIASLPGRGRQLAAGIAATSRPWLLLLHGDTILADGWAEAARRHMRGEAAGYFRFVLDSEDVRARRLERLVAWRCRVLRLPYGDQGLLLPRRLLAEAGGMPDLPLMEDVALVRRLRRHLRPIHADAVTSAARWERDGWYRRSARNLLCLALYVAGVPARWIVRLYR